MAMTPGTSCYVTFPGTEVRPTYLQVAHTILLTFSEGCGDISYPPVFRYLSCRKEQGKMSESYLAVTAGSSLSMHTHLFTAQAFADILSA